jgi:hypothetical protein
MFKLIVYLFTQIFANVKKKLQFGNPMQVSDFDIFTFGACGANGRLHKDLNIRHK